MNLNIYLENNLGQQLRERAATLKKTRNAIIREAIQEWIMRHRANTWPAIIRNYKGMKDFPRFESHRKALRKTKDDPFA